MKKILGWITRSAMVAVMAGIVVPSVTHAATSTQSVAFPMYEYPTIGTLWSDIHAAGSQVPFLIVNPGSGPGASVDPIYTSSIADNTTAGQRSIGYVYTSYQVRSLTDVLADIDDWYQMYPGISGIFVDLIKNGTADDLCYAATVHNYIKSKHPTDLVVMNPGANIEARYEPYADIFMNAENFYSAYTSWTPLTDGFENNPAYANRFWHAIHTTSAAQLSSALTLTRNNNAGWVLLTDETMPNPYTAVPSYWSTFLNDVASLPPTAIPNRGPTALPAGCLDLSMQTTSQNNYATKQVNATVANTITNTDSTRTSWGTTRLTYSVPAGTTLSSLSAGSGWSCSVGSGVCDYAGSIAAGASPPTVNATIAVGCNYQSGSATVTVKNFANNTGTATVALAKPADCASGSTQAPTKKTKSSGGSTVTTTQTTTPPVTSDEPVTTTTTTAPRQTANSSPQPSQATDDSAETPEDGSNLLVRAGPVVLVLAVLTIGAIIWWRRRASRPPAI